MPLCPGWLHQNTFFAFSFPPWQSILGLVPGCVYSRATFLSLKASVVRPLASCGSFLAVHLAFRRCCAGTGGWRTPPAVKSVRCRWWPTRHAQEQEDTARWQIGLSAAAGPLSLGAPPLAGNRCWFSLSLVVKIVQFVLGCCGSLHLDSSPVASKLFSLPRSARFPRDVK